MSAAMTVSLPKGYAKKLAKVLADADEDNDIE